MVASVSPLKRSLKREWRFLLACARFLPTPGSFARGGMTCAKRRFAFSRLTRSLIRSITALLGILTEDPTKTTGGEGTTWGSEAGRASLWLAEVAIYNESISLLIRLNQSFNPSFQSIISIHHSINQSIDWLSHQLINQSINQPNVRTLRGWKEGKQKTTKSINQSVNWKSRGIKLE